VQDGGAIYRRSGADGRRAGTCAHQSCCSLSRHPCEQLLRSSPPRSERPQVLRLFNGGQPRSIYGGRPFTILRSRHSRRREPVASRGISIAGTCWCTPRRHHGSDDSIYDMIPRARPSANEAVGARDVWTEGIRQIALGCSRSQAL
jgi:hypothetical protein